MTDQAAPAPVPTLADRLAQRIGALSSGYEVALAQRDELTDALRAALRDCYSEVERAEGERDQAISERDYYETLLRSCRHVCDDGTTRDGLGNLVEDTSVGEESSPEQVD